VAGGFQVSDRADGHQTRDVRSADDYVARLLKLLPAEITGAYLGVRTILTPESNENDWVILVFAIIIFVIAPFYMYFLLKMRYIMQMVFLLFSYVVWVANVEIQRISFRDQQIHFFIDQLSGIGIIRNSIAFIIAPAFIKGLLVIWVLLLAPFVFARPASKSNKDNKSTEPGMRELG